MTILYKDPIATFGKDYVFPLSWLRLFFFWHGSLVQRLLFEVWMWVGFAALIITVKLYVKAWPAELLRVLASLANILSPILTFMLGFYTSTIYSRWWAARTSMCGMAQAAAYNIALELTQVVYDDDDPVLVARLKQRIVRWCNLAFGIVLKEVILDGDHLYNSYETMEKIGLVTHEERMRLERDVDRTRFTLPLMWAGHTLTRLRDQNHRFGLTDWMHIQLSQQLANLRAGLGSMFVLVYVPVPLMYRQLVSATVRIYILVFVLLAGNLQLLDSSTALDRGNERWYDIISVVVVFFVYIGWLHVADELANPYRIAPDGLDFDDYLSSQRADLATMVDDNSIKLPTVDSIAEEPIPGDPHWNCPFLWRDHTYEAVPGWHKYKDFIREQYRDRAQKSKRALLKSTYDFFQTRRNAELHEEYAQALGEDASATEATFSAGTPRAVAVNSRALRGAPRSWTGPANRIKYLGF